jgi:predicted DNA-binding transcriptional regulator AlpA
MDGIEQGRLLVDYPGLKALGIKFHRSWLNRLIAQDRFPQPIQIGEHTRAWRIDDIKAWIDNLPPMPSASWQWVTDGKRNKRIEKSKPVPRGWRIGRIAVNKKTNGDEDEPRGAKQRRTSASMRA